MLNFNFNFIYLFISYLLNITQHRDPSSPKLGDWEMLCCIVVVSHLILQKKSVKFISL